MQKTEQHRRGDKQGSQGEKPQRQSCLQFLPEAFVDLSQMTSNLWDVANLYAELSDAIVRVKVSSAGGRRR